jgi:Ankyrin repeats (3 copies)
LRKVIIKYFKEVKEKQTDEYEHSILSTSTAESIGKKETWDELKKELEEVGIDNSVLSEKKGFITEVLRQAMEDGLIDESDISTAASTLTPGTANASTAQLERWDTEGTLLDEAYTQRRQKTAAPIDAEAEMSELLSQYTKGGRNASKKHGKFVSLVLRTLGIASDERLIEAADEGDTAATVRLIGRGANPRATDKWLWTPLHMAAYGGFEPIARILIHTGADISARTVDGETPLLLAERNGHKGVVDIISEELERRERRKEENAEVLGTGKREEKVVVREVEKAKKIMDDNDRR